MTVVEELARAELEGGASSDAPSDIERAYAEWLPLARATQPFYKVENAVVDRFNAAYLAKPDVLRWRRSDFGLVGFERWPDKPLFVDSSKEGRKKLREVAADRDDPRCARASEILKGFKDFEAEMKKFGKAIGVDDAEKASDVVCEAAHQAALRVLAAPVRNFRDIAFRAAVAKHHGFINDEGEVDFLLDRLIELAGVNLP